MLMSLNVIATEHRIATYLRNFILNKISYLQIVKHSSIEELKLDSLE